MAELLVIAMKPNILRRFAINDLKNHKLDSFVTSITIFIVILILLIGNLVIPIILNHDLLEAQYYYGYSEYSSYFETKEEFESLKIISDGKQIFLDDKRIDDVVVKDCGYTFYHDQVCDVEGNGSIVAYELLEGRNPENETEAAIKKSVLTKWGYPTKISQTITLSYLCNDEVIQKEFQVVGILEERGTCDISIKQDECETYTVAFNTDLPIDNVVQYGQDSNVIDGNFLENKDDQLNYWEQNISKQDINIENARISRTLQAMINVIVIIIASGVLYGFILTSFEKRKKDFTLLRSIGATKRQLYYVIFLQTSLLAIIPIIIACILIEIIAIILSSILSISLLLSASQLGYCIATAYGMSLVCYFIPARSATYQALIGAFEQQEFTYFYYRYKKLHQMRPLYLGWRKIASLKRKVIVKVIIIAFISFNLIHMVLPYLQTSDIDISNPNLFQYELPLDFDLNSLQELKDDVASLIVTKAYYSYEGVPYGVRTYCNNDDLQHYYQIKELKRDEVVISKGALEELPVDNDTNEIDFFDHTFKIIQVLDDNQDFVIFQEDDFKTYEIYFNQETKYQELQLVFQDENQRNEAVLKHPNIMLTISRNDITYHPDETSSSINYVLVIIISSLFIIYLYQAMFELLKEREDIGSYQILGLTNKEISKIYFYKLCYINSIGLLIGLGYFIMDKTYQYSFDAVMKIPVLFAVIISVMSLFVLSMLSLLPLRFILHNSGIENKNWRD